MSASTWSMRCLHAVDEARIDGLADVLIDCVEGGASVTSCTRCCATTPSHSGAVWQKLSLRATTRCWSPKMRWAYTALCSCADTA
jgi:hypothetical protein